MNALPLLTLDAISLKFGGLTALSEVSLGVASQGVHGIIGPNGAGKSTLFNLISGIYKPTYGRIVFQGHQLQKMNATQISCLGIARTFQNIRLLQHLSILDNVRMVAAVEREGTFWKSLFGVSSTKKMSAEIRDRAHTLLDLVGLSKSYQKLPYALPYGDQRKLEIARALMRKPKLLLLDEPAAGMNPNEKNSLNIILKKIVCKNITILVIEHDMKFIMDSCKYITVLSQGSVCAEGSSVEIQNNPTVIEVYLGKKSKINII